MLPMVKTLSPATATLEKPEPTPVAFQASGGPSLGHSLSRPLSGEMSSRLGPRNCGQSAAGAFDLGGPASGNGEQDGATNHAPA